MNFQPPDPTDWVDDFAPCDRCLHDVPNDELHLRDGVGRWSGFYLCLECFDDAAGEILAAKQQRWAATVSELARRYVDEMHKADAVFAQHQAAIAYAEARRLA